MGYMVEAMTENKRYTYNDFGEIFRDKEIFAYSCSMSNAKAICKELNGQDKEIKRLKCINRQLEERLDKSIALDMSQCGDVE